ncbi:hypothetical protein STH22820_12110 [Edwardsiella ictaluri]|nr:hypothetical protein STH22820_12110 [Edwardsiella ictaluri]
MGDAYDNAMAESINGLYKAEMIHRQRGKTLQRQSGPHWRGRTGTTIVGYWNGSVISPRWNRKNENILPRGKRKGGPAAPAKTPPPQTGGGTPKRGGGVCAGGGGGFILKKIKGGGGIKKKKGGKPH